MMFKEKLMQPRYYRLLAAVALSGAIAASLLMLDQHRDSSSAPSPAASPGATPSSGNPAADRAHELKALQQELEQKPGHAPILLRMAQISSELGKRADAISYLQQLVKADPKSVDGHLELGRLLYENKDVEGSLRETLKILDINPKQVDALYNLGAIYANLNNAQLARTYWNRAVASDPNSDSGKRARDGLNKLALPPAGTSAAVHP